MALIGDNLGLAIYNARQTFNDIPYNTLLQKYGTIEGIKIAMAKAEGNAIINYLKTNTSLQVPSLGFIAPPDGGPVEGQSTTGIIQ